MKKRRSYHALLALSMTLGLGACGGGNETAYFGSMTSEQSAKMDSELKLLGLTEEQVLAVKTAAIADASRPSNVPERSWYGARRIVCFFMPWVPSCKKMTPTPTPTPTPIPTFLPGASVLVEYTPTAWLVGDNFNQQTSPTGPLNVLGATDKTIVFSSFERGILWRRTYCISGTGAPANPDGQTTVNRRITYAINLTDLPAAALTKLQDMQFVQYKLAPVCDAPNAASMSLIDQRGNRRNFYGSNAQSISCDDSIQYNVTLEGQMRALFLELPSVSAAIYPANCDASASPSSAP